MGLAAIPPDQRAVLQLVLQQGRSYDDLAGLLGIEAETVRRRAHAALSSLGPGGTVDPGDEARITDFLLSQASGSEAAATRDLIAGEPAARAWAQAVSDQISELAPGGLPDLPGSAAAATGTPPAPEPAPVAAREAEDEDDQDHDDDRSPYSYFPDEGGGRSRRSRASAGSSSRLGGALLLGGVGIVLAVILILVLSGGDDKKNSAGVDTTSTQASTTAATGASGATGTTAVPDPVAQIQLRAADGSKAVGLAQVFARGKQRAVIVAGQGVQPGAYALWLYNSQSDARLLGFVPARVGKDGRFVTQGALPTGAGKFKEMVITHEQVAGQNPAAPKTPGAVVLRGVLKGTS